MSAKGPHSSAGRLFHCAVALSVSTALPAASFAQDSDDDDLQLEEIVVTAEKRESTLIEVPAAITVLTGEALAERRVLSNEDLVRLVPSMNFTSFGSASGEASLQMRGLSTAYGLSPVVSYYVDETPMDLREDGNTSTSSIDFYDIERVEVLRGPQGTIYGASSLGGTVRVITNKPNPEAFETSAEATYETLPDGGDGITVRGMLNVPLGDRTALRLVASSQDFPGYTTRVRPDSYYAETPDDPVAGTDLGDATRLTVRAALGWEASDTLTITPSVVVQNTEGTGSLQWDQTRPEFTYAGDFDRSDDVDLTIGNLLIEKDFSKMSLISSTSVLNKESRSEDDFSDFMAFFSEVVFDGFPTGSPTPVYFTVDESPVDYDQISQEFRLVSTGDGAFNWIAGVYFNQTELDSNQNIYSDYMLIISEPIFGVTPPTDEFSVYNAPSKDTQIALFVDGTWNVTDKLTLQAGLRAYELEQEFEINWTGLFAGDSAEKTTQKVDDITPRVIVSYAFTDDLNAYGSVSEGFRPGGTNTALGGNPPCDFEDVYRPFYESDSVTNYEVGLKSFFANRRASVNVAVYQVDWENIQSTVNSNCGIFNANFGEAEVDGVEIEGQFNFTDFLSMYFGYSYNDARFTNFKPGFEGVGGFTPGQKLPNIPETQYSIGGEITFPGIGRSEGFFRADYQYADETRTSNNFPDRIRPEYKNLNLALGLSWETFAAELFVRNATDELHVFGINNRFANPDFLSYTVGRPISYGLTVRYAPQ